MLWIFEKNEPRLLYWLRFVTDQIIFDSFSFVYLSLLIKSTCDLRDLLALAMFFVNLNQFLFSDLDPMIEIQWTFHVFECFLRLFAIKFSKLEKLGIKVVSDSGGILKSTGAADINIIH